MNQVRLTKNYETMEYHSQDPFNPHPVFPQWSPHSVYPYSYWGTMTRRVENRTYFMPALENDFVRVTVAADIGGRIWDFYDKIGHRHLANYNIGVRCYNAGFGLNYTTGGIECNYPLAHSCTTNMKREVSFQRSPDGSAAIICSEYDRIWRTRWSVAYVLYPDRSYVELRVRIYNRTPQDSRYLYWNNCGFVLHKGTQFIFPEDEAAMHGKELTTFSWPTWRRHDMSLFKDIAPQPLGLYFLNAREPYFGYYDHDEQFGLVHYADLADLPGKKYWTWGTDPGLVEHYRKTHHTLNEVYGEVQSGRIVIQEHLDRVPPETECEWSERWYPVRGIGAFNGAGPGAAMHVEVVERTGKLTRIRIAAIANALYPEARLIVTSDGLTPVEQEIALDPWKKVERIVTLPGKAGPDEHTVITLADRNAGILGQCRLRHPNKRDCWREVVVAPKEVTPVGVEEIFRQAEAKARDWGNHDLKPLYEKAIAQDSGFSPARRELGKVALWRGLYEEAVKHLEIARKRDPDSLKIRYFYALALLHLGRVEDARQMFELACRYDWEMRSLARLAEMRMREKDWRHALVHLDRVAAAHPRLTRCRGLRAACLRKLGRKGEASAEISAARKIDGQDPFLQFEEMFIKSSRLNARRLPVPAVKALIEQVRGAEPPLLEAAFDYYGVGLYAEAEAVIGVIPDAGPLANFLLAHIQEKLGRHREAVQTLRKACRQDPTYHHAWHLEFIPILQWARQQLPREPRPLLHLGNLLMARRRTDEGVALWREAERLGEKHYLLFSSLGYYHKRIAADPETALRYFQKADRVSGGDLYVKQEVFDALCALGRKAEAQKYLEGEMKSVLASPRLAHSLLTTYLDENRFDKFDALCQRLNFSVNWQIPGPHHLWMRRQMQEAILLYHRGSVEEALNKLLHITPLPPNLGMLSQDNSEDDRRFYYIGCANEKLGRLEEARRYWEKALEISYFSGYEPAYSFRAWTRRYYHALSLQKLGRKAEAESYFDAMEALAANEELPKHARERLMDLVERGRFAPDAEKDPAVLAAIEVATRAEL